MDDDATIGRRIKSARVNNELRREDLARLMPMSRMGIQTIGKIERGERRLEPHEAVVFAEALGITVDYLYTGEQPPAEPSSDLAAIEARLAAIEEHLAAADASITAQLSVQDGLLAEIRTVSADIRALVEPLRGVTLEVTEPVEELGTGGHPPVPEAPPSAQTAEQDSSNTDDRDDQDLASRRQLP